ncbi:phage tail length tape measure family protein [Mesorhizobium salmacidum]|uniref:phage tail length tape measure family protein n=1 Tax=Mesorhizobium salmacidum TaxID=3015171 RepID=UPI00301DA82B
MALDGLNTRYTVLARQSLQTAGGLGAVGGAARLTSNQLLNLSRQGNDVITMFALGAPPMMIFASQAGQIYDALESGPKGLRGSLAGIASGVKSTATSLISGAAAFVSFSNPVGLVATGIIAGTAALLTYSAASRQNIRSIDDILKDHQANIKGLKDAYGEAADGAIAYAKAAANEGRTGIALPIASTVGDLKLSLAAAAQEAAKGVLANDNSQAGGSQFGPTVLSKFKDFADAIEYLRSTSARGAPDILGFRKMVTERWELDPTNQELLRQAQALHSLTDEAAKAALALPGAQAALERLLARGRPTVADEQGRLDYGDQNAANLTWLQRQNEAALGRIGARSPQELADAARAAEAARPSASGESAAVRQYRVDAAGALALAQAQNQLAEAQRQRSLSLDRTLLSARQDIGLIGQTTAATEALRLENQLLAQVQEEAARNHVAVDKAEIDSIHQKAIEYGKLRAIQEALATIHSQVQDIELQRAELGLIGQNTLAHDRAIASFKAEQQIRQLGIPLYGAEAEAIRKNTAELSSLAEASAKARLARDLQFEREQMFRSPTEQNVASTMQSAGLDYDPNSLIAQQIRYNEQLKTTKAAWEDIFSTVNDGIDGISDALFSGGSITDALKKAGQQLAKTMFDMAVTNPLKNWLTGGNFNTIADLGIFGNGATSGKGGGFGGVLGQMLGAQKAVASMQVQAASVFINGSPLGGIPGLGGVPGAANDNGGIFSWFKSLFGGGVSKPFQADTTLSDLLGAGSGPNTAASAAKLLSRLGSPLGALSGSASSSLTGSMASYASAIKMIESAGSGGYSALGPLLKNGNQALGAYQVMKSNLPSWSTEAFGSPMSPTQFLGNSAAQDAVFEQQFGKLLSKYGNPQDAASAWFTGGPLSAGAGKMDVLGTTGSVYVDKFNAALGQATQNVGQLGGASTGALSNLVSSTSQAAGGLNALGSGAGKLGSMLNQFPAAPGGGGGGGGGGWLGSLFGSLFGGGASVSSMNAISPMATADILSGSWGLFANGAAFRRGNVVPFAKGDVFSSPTYFPMSAGRTGMLGEDGDEAIMPLRRGPDGRLGVVNHQPLRAPRAANANNGAGGSSGGLTAGHIQAIVGAISDKLKLNANIINLQDGSDIKRWMMSEDGHATVAVVNKRLGG